jgi:hypothetical protein
MLWLTEPAAPISGPGQDDAEVPQRPSPAAVTCAYVQPLVSWRGLPRHGHSTGTP